MIRQRLRFGLLSRLLTFSPALEAAAYRLFELEMYSQYFRHSPEKTRAHERIDYLTDQKSRPRLCIMRSDSVGKRTWGRGEGS
jgi:hypothetical protein